MLPTEKSPAHGQLAGGERPQGTQRNAGGEKYSPSIIPYTFRFHLSGNLGTSAAATQETSIVLLDNCRPPVSKGTKATGHIFQHAVYMILLWRRTRARAQSPNSTPCHKWHTSYWTRDVATHVRLSFRAYRVKLLRAKTCATIDMCMRPSMRKSAHLASFKIPEQKQQK